MSAAICIYLALISAINIIPALAVSSDDMCLYELNGARLPLDADCGKFVVCHAQRVAIVGSCPHGLHFNAAANECDFKWRAGCATLNTFAASDDGCDCSCCADTCDGDDQGDDNQTETTITGDTITTDCDTEQTTQMDDNGEATDTTLSTTVDYPSSTTDLPITKPTESVAPSHCFEQRADCINEVDNTILLVKEDCTKYITCSRGCTITQQCNSGLYYQIKGNYCDYPQNVNCTNPVDSGATSVATGPSGTTCNNPGVCKNMPDGKLFASPNSNGYIVCQCGCSIEMNCPAGLVFNETIQVCDYDRISGWDIPICPDNLVYNAISNECDYPENYVPKTLCNNTSPICKDQPDGTLFPYEGVCNMFYKCDFGCAVPQECPNNLIYDTKWKLCNYPQDVKCDWPYPPPSSGRKAGSFR